MTLRQIARAVPLCVVGALLLAGPARAQPRHILSLNLCSDQLLLALADAGDIAGVTRLARDCRISAACRAAAAVPSVRGTAEEVIAAMPDLVLAGPSGAQPAVQAARKLGIPLLALETTPDLDAIRRQMAQVAAALGRPERGAALVVAFDKRLATIPLPDRDPGARPLAAVLQPNGFTAGAASLADAVLARAGLDNAATRHGLDRPGPLPLEVLILHRPDLLITDRPADAPSMAEALLWHPALRTAFADRRVEVPGRDWICGGPATLDAVERLARARRDLAP
ncbi:MAG: ABC transporter substrate-binding protein [Acetobacteraceae bacterium]